MSCWCFREPCGPAHCTLAWTRLLLVMFSISSSQEDTPDCLPIPSCFQGPSLQAVWSFLLHSCLENTCLPHVKWWGSLAPPVAQPSVPHPSNGRPLLVAFQPGGSPVPNLGERDKVWALWFSWLLSLQEELLFTWQHDTPSKCHLRSLSPPFHVSVVCAEGVGGTLFTEWHPSTCPKGRGLAAELVILASEKVEYFPTLVFLSRGPKEKIPVCSNWQYCVTIMTTLQRSVYHLPKLGSDVRTYDSTHSPRRYEKLLLRELRSLGRAEQAAQVSPK